MTVGIPEVQDKQSDVLDLITDSCKKESIGYDPEGKPVTLVELDTNKLWWKSQQVASFRFGYFTNELERFEALATDCYNFMSKERADVISKQIMAIGYAFRCSIDAKSSESMRDMHNAQSTLLNLVTRVKIEKQYTMKDAMKGNFVKGVFNREQDNEAND